MPSSHSGSPSRSQADDHPDDRAHEISSLKRRLVALQHEVDDAAGTRVKKPPYVSLVMHSSPSNHHRSKTTTMGRGIRRLVSLFEPVDDIITEADFRIQNGSQLPEPHTADEIEARLA